MMDRQWTSWAVARCVDQGVDHFFLAPGSRCTPLTLAVAEATNVQVTQHFDERGLAFAALGYARATGRPGVFICTSGTAVANAYPAVIEAAMERIPLLLFTADRPPELRDTGANQTIDQQHIFAGYPRWFFDLPCPTPSIKLDFVSSIVDRAIAESISGPVHLNWMFREPFGLDSLPPIEPSSKSPPAAKPVPGVGADVTLSGNTVVLLGDCRPDEARLVQRFAREHDLPLFTDITSGLRELPPDVASQLPTPDTIVHFGGRVVSKSWHTWLQSLDETRIIHVSPRGIHVNPHHLAQEWYSEPIARMRWNVRNQNTQPFQQAWQAIHTHYRSAVDDLLGAPGASARTSLTEPEIALLVASQIRDGHGLFLGNSMPIRDFDRYAFWSPAKDIVVGANRGASGIDGLIATGVGFADGLERPTTVVLGDLSSLHDLNSFALLAKSKHPVTLVIINNQAGGIFDMLPVAKRTDHFEQYFATPHSLDFRDAARMFGIPYASITDETQTPADDFRRLYADTLDQGTTTVLEAKTSRQANQLLRRQIQEQLER